jgi:ABC-type Na+ transport system ATPase subunit NatA
VVNVLPLDEQQLKGILAKVRTKGLSAQIAVDEIVNELSNVMGILYDEKNAKIKELEEKLSVYEKLESKVEKASK